MSGLNTNHKYLVYWRGVFGAGMSTRKSNSPQYRGRSRKRIYFGSTSSTTIVNGTVLAKTEQMNQTAVWYDGKNATIGDANQWNVAEAIVDETGSLCLWADIEWESYADNLAAGVFYGYLHVGELSVLISEFKK